MRRSLILLCAISCLLPLVARAGFFDSDPLAVRDQFGLLHQMPVVEPTDLAPRHTARFEYYFLTGEAVSADPAYVGALQNGLLRFGYYCGPVDGVFSPAVSAAIARLQKNCSQRVTGTVTLGVRRALHLP